jgi:hypothetical protein
MIFLRRAVYVACFFFLPMIAGCTGGYDVNNDASMSAIRSAEETGASGVPGASYYLGLAKTGLANAGDLAVKGRNEEAESMLLRAQVDAELAMVLSLQDADKKDAAQAINRFRQLRDGYQLLREGKP